MSNPMFPVRNPGIDEPVEIPLYLAYWIWLKTPETETLESIRDKGGWTPQEMDALLPDWCYEI